MISHFYFSRCILSLTIFFGIIIVLTIVRRNTTLTNKCSFVNFPKENEDVIILQNTKELQLRTVELLSIHRSVRNEMIRLERERTNMMNTIVTFKKKIENIRTSYTFSKQYIEQLNISVESYRKTIATLSELAKIYSERPLSYFSLPSFGLVNRSMQMPAVADVGPKAHQCSMHTCFEWSVCSLQKEFLRVCGFQLSRLPPKLPAEYWKNALVQSPNFVDDCRNACLQVVFDVANIEASQRRNSTLQPPPSILYIDPPIHLSLIVTLENTTLHPSADTGLHSPLLVASTNFTNRRSFRAGYDILLAVVGPVNYHSFVSVPRKYLIGASLGLQTDTVVWGSWDSLAVLLRAAKKLTHLASHLNFHLHGEEQSPSLSPCWPSPALLPIHPTAGWIPCRDALEILSNSTFGLLLDARWNWGQGYPSVWRSVGDDADSSLPLQLQISSCLSTGAIPVLLEDGMAVRRETCLPLWEALRDNWLRSVVIVPLARLPELFEILTNIPINHIVEMRRQGQIIWRRYLHRPEVQSSTLLLALSRRLGYAQPRPPVIKAIPAFSAGANASPTHSFQPSAYHQPRFDLLRHYNTGETLGPQGPQQDASPVAFINFYSPFVSANQPLEDQIWNYLGTPWDPFLPTDAQHHPGGTVDFRPINHSRNTYGVEFAADLGGMHPYEQFTVVLLFYNRTKIALEILEGLFGLSYLHSVLVVWNSPMPPPHNLSWPKLHVPVHVINAGKNSLNNRFLPYSLIKTEAILSLDDDVRLHHDEIIFGFRVWRENRDRLVGYPARFHYWSDKSQSWIYSSKRACEASMILTGATFLHRYYLQAYSTVMNSEIRQFVDTIMNCEDIAMNFLVSHITRKAPIKVTPRHSFACIDCETTLFMRPSHILERSYCINKLITLYGYNPLVYTQFRADSHSFGIQTSSNVKKCFLNL